MDEDLFIMQNLWSKFKVKLEGYCLKLRFKLKF
jgi:hypothetical protein